MMDRESRGAQTREERMARGRYSSSVNSDEWMLAFFIALSFAVIGAGWLFSIVHTAHVVKVLEEQIDIMAMHNSRLYGWEELGVAMRGRMNGGEFIQQVTSSR